MSEKYHKLSIALRLDGEGLGTKNYYKGQFRLAVKDLDDFVKEHAPKEFEGDEDPWEPDREYQIGHAHACGYQN